MDAIMAVLKRNLFEIACGLAVVLGIVVALLAYTQYDNVRQRMSQGTALANEVAKYQKDPINPRLIEREEQFNSQIEKQHEDVLALAATKNARKPLLDNVFPLPTSDSVPFEFVQAYEAAFSPLLVDLHARGAPTQADFDYYAKVIERERREQEVDLPPGQPTPVGRSQPGQPGEGMTPEELVRRDEQWRASIEIARQVHCYATAASFDRVVFPEGLPPNETLMWQAQLGLWIQQDVVRAIKRVNEAAAERHRNKHKKPAWVAHLPVKQLVSIAVFGYQGQQPGREIFQSGGGRGTAAASFTELNSCELYDVIQFGLQVVVDSRDLNRLIDELYKTNFYVLIDADLRQVPVASDQVGMIFGGSPVVEVQLVFEGYLLRDNYVALMPAAICSALGIREAAPGKPG